jgi:dUTP diphosphatase|nr:MAG TPA: dUTPase [Caudoviricetes sp.]
MTGIGHELPQGFFGKIYGRSGLSKMGIISVGGVIDENYRGIIGV